MSPMECCFRKSNDRENHQGNGRHQNLLDTHSISRLSHSPLCMSCSFFTQSSVREISRWNSSTFGKLCSCGSHKRKNSETTKSMHLPLSVSEYKTCMDVSRSAMHGSMKIVNAVIWTSSFFMIFRRGHPRLQSWEERRSPPY